MFLSDLEFPREERMVAGTILEIYKLGWWEIFKEMVEDSQLIIADFLDDEGHPVLAEMIRNRLYYFCKKKKTFRVCQPKSQGCWYFPGDNRLILRDYMGREHTFPVTRKTKPKRYVIEVVGHKFEERSVTVISAYVYNWHNYIMPI
jgi:hypothetical protein